MINRNGIPHHSMAKKIILSIIVRIAVLGIDTATTIPISTAHVRCKGFFHMVFWAVEPFTSNGILNTATPLFRK